MIDPKKETDTERQDGRQDGWYLLFASWLVSASASLGSLFLDKALGMEPCTLCWFQRIFMYPLAIVLLVGLMPLDRGAARYGLALAVPGWLTAFYHLLVHAGVIPESLQPCGAGPSCLQDDLNLFGFISIPMLSLLAFTGVIALLLYFLKRTSQ